MISRRRFLVGGAFTVVTVTDGLIGTKSRAIKIDPADLKSDDHCPFCGEREDIRRFVYGLYGGPPPGPCGGCIIRKDSPKWYCYNCGRHWGRYRG
jgi:predicted RNA-binding Zn-ribbon protein involved in translation (DUF1610 family)